MLNRTDADVKLAIPTFNATTGLTDVEFSSTGPGLYLASPGPYAVIDWDGDGDHEIIAGSGEVFNFTGSWVPTGFDLDGGCANYHMQQEEPPYDYAGSICLYAVGDVDGDGLDDVVRGHAEYSNEAPTPNMAFELFLNPIAAPAPPLAVPVDSLVGGTVDATALGHGIYAPRLIDLDGDAHADFTIDKNRAHVDLNGDGLPDHILKSDLEGFINKGNGQHQGGYHSAWGPNGIYFLGGVVNDPIYPLAAIADIDGDGRQDIATIDASLDLEVHLSRVGRLSPSDLTLPIVTLVPGVATAAYNPPVVGDVDGNGLLDILVNGTLLQQVGIDGDRLKTVTNGFGATDTLSYGPLAPRGFSAGQYTDPDPVHLPSDSPECTFPQRCLRRGHPVLKSRVVSDPDRPSTDRFYYYRYKGRRVDLRGRGDLGFEEVETRVSGVTTTTTYVFDWAGSPQGLMFYVSRGLPVERTTSFWHEGGTRELSSTETIERWRGGGRIAGGLLLAGVIAASGGAGVLVVGAGTLAVAAVQATTAVAVAGALSAIASGISLSASNSGNSYAPTKPTKPTRLSPKWRPRKVDDPKCQDGCENVAKQIQRMIGGNIHRFEPPAAHPPWERSRTLIQDGLTMRWSSTTVGYTMPLPATRDYQ